MINIMCFNGFHTINFQIMPKLMLDIKISFITIINLATWTTKSHPVEIVKEKLLKQRLIE